MLERDVEAYLVKRAKALGGVVRKVKWLGRTGAPDRLVLLPGNSRALWVELKRPGGKADMHQLREHEVMRALGQSVTVLDSIEAIDEWLGVEWAWVQSP